MGRLASIGLLLALTLCATSSTARADATVEGDWVLVEQGYGDGRANLPVAPAHDERISLEVRREGAGYRLHVASGRTAKSRRPWPAWVTDQGPLPLEVLERTFDDGGRGFGARYRVSPAANGDTILDVVERYRIDGEALVGVVAVTFRRDGEPRGSYTLHRRFERAP